MYDLFYSQKAEKSLLKLPTQIQKRILAGLERARVRPQAHFERLVGMKVYKLRVGDYRIIADIHTGELRILVIEIGNRRNIYK
ncbi:MAG: mRNA interferase RelE/StbE [Candidatus Woesearchaeota archaeon]|jgi:mRNA interferase RelE/StbE